jgi:cold shock CspA family protein
MDRINGVITKIHPNGWGFITSRDKPFTRIFFHWSHLSQGTLKFPDLKKGMKVEFESVEFHDRGLRAIRIKVLE